MTQAKEGDTVKVHYKGILSNGDVFDDSHGRAPLEFTLGEGQIIPGFDNAVKGLTPGDTCTEKIPCDEAYGEIRDDLVASVERSNLPDEIDPEVGQRLQMQQQNGQRLNVVITEVDEESITVDANHPLSGEDLTFEIELIDIVS